VIFAENLGRKFVGRGTYKQSNAALPTVISNCPELSNTKDTSTMFGPMVLLLAALGDSSSHCKQPVGDLSLI
jgi:hypothetical protein